MSPRRVGGVLETPPDEELAIVCANGNAERVQELLDFDVDPNGRVEEQSDLHVALLHGHQVVVTRLLRAGASVFRHHMQAAIRGGNHRCADRILDELHFAGEELDLDFMASEILYERKVAAALPPAMFEWLKAHGVDLSAPDRLGRTIRELAAMDHAPAETLAALDALMA